MNANKLNEMQR